jgi:signal transduction histidine kinase/HAMP domain-containing protein
MVTRLQRGLIVFIMLLGVAGVLVFAGIRQQDHLVDNVVGRLQPLEVANQQLRADFANSQAALHAYLDTRERRFLRIYRATRGALTGAEAGAAARAAGASREDIATQRQAARAWYGFGDRMLGHAPGSPAVIRLTNQGFSPSYRFYQANSRLRDRLRAQSHLAITDGLRTLDRWLAVAGVLAALAALLGVAAAAGTVRSITRPLRSLQATLHRLRSGDQAARAEVTGAAETREVAASLNALADEGDRLRAQEAESASVLAMARDAGFRIREHLRVEDVIGEARATIEQKLGADVAYLHVMEDGKLGPPIGHEHDWVMPAGFLDDFTSVAQTSLSRLFERGTSLVIQDMQGADGDRVLPLLREPLRRAGIVSHMVTPFGAGSELLGLIVAERTRPGHPWKPAEVAAVEWIAADVGRGLHQARIHEAEERLVQDLRAVDRVKSDFLATVSHELRTPLTSIAGYVELLSDREPGPLTPDQEQMLVTVNRNTARLRHLIEDVLTLSKIESGAFTTTTQPVNLAELIAAAVAALQPRAASQGVTLTLASEQSLLVDGDAGQLDRVLMNLLSNAVKFTPSGGEVRVTGVSEGPMAVVAVSDSGIGIPEGDQDQLFSRFFRAANAVERSIPGTGLGLAIARTIVANHGGNVALWSREGSGTTVTVRIPLLAVPATPGD